MTSTPTTVGLLGHNGRVGSAILSALAPLHATNYTVVILHRPGSDLSSVPSGIETREIDLSKEDGKDFDAAVKGLHVLVSAVSGTGVAGQASLIPALSRSKEFVTFFPSDFGAPWTKDDLKDTLLGFLHVKDKLIKDAKKAGVATTSVKTGLFAELLFKNAHLGVDAKENVVNVYKNSLTASTPITSLGYIAQAYLDLLQDPHKAAKKEFYLIELKTTYQKVVDILTELHGTAPRLIEWSEEKLHEALNDNIGSAISAGLLKKSGEDTWNYPGERVVVHGYQGKSLRDWLVAAKDR